VKDIQSGYPCILSMTGRLKESMGAMKFVPALKE